MRTTLLIMLLICLTPQLKAQKVAVKSNLLYGATTLTPNLGVEIGLGKRTTLDLSGGYNWFNLKGSVDNNKKLVHWLVQPEFRYYTCERFNGHFFGVHGLYAQYNINQYELPLLFGKGSKAFRYEGSALGAGFSYGYQYAFAKYWAVEGSIGVGYMNLKYDKYNCYKCSETVDSDVTHHYFGPTKAAISIIYAF